MLIRVSGIKFPADQERMFVTSCRPGSSGIKAPAAQDPVLYNIMLIPSSGIKSPADQELRLQNIMLIRFFKYNLLLIRSQCYIMFC